MTNKTLQRGDWLPTWCLHTSTLSGHYLPSFKPWLMRRRHCAWSLVVEGGIFSFFMSSSMTLRHFFRFGPLTTRVSWDVITHTPIDPCTAESTWPNHRRRLVRSRSSISGICSLARSRSDLTWSLSFTPHIHRIMALSVRRILLISFVVIGQHSEAYVMALRTKVL